MAKDQHRAAACTPSGISLPSRVAAISACRDALDLGPVLLTGAAGVGKTWLVKSLTTESRLAWISVDVAPGMSVREFSLSLLVALGEQNPAEMTRVALAQSLAARSGDGRKVALIVDEAHGASDEILEEIRLLTNRLGQPDGFAAMVICGQTPLARRLESRNLEGFESRLAARVHLMPLDERETRVWAESRLNSRILSADEVEDLVRESGGIPSRLDRLLPRLKPSRLESAAPVAATALPSVAIMAPPILPAKPPLHVEDGMIEVGWDSDVDADLDAEFEAEIASRDAEILADGDEQPVDDHYAAIQAWDEWVKNQGRAPTPVSASASSDDPVATEGDQDVPQDESEISALESLPGTWAEGRHGFGPYSQLFARVPASKSAE